MPTWLPVLVTALVKHVALVLLFVMPLASVLTWMERRQSAMMQDRLGPNRANIGGLRLGGLLHVLADGLKMFFKEDFVPGRAHRTLFTLAPILALAPVLITFAIIPFGPTVCLDRLADHAPAGLGFAAAQAWCGEGTAHALQVVHVEIGLLFYFAIMSLANYGAALAGWSSYNKWATLGGLRASSQMMSYEVTMGLSLLGAFLVYGSLEPMAIVEAQGSSVLGWGVVTQPLGFVLFFTAAIAETKRAPFDLPEGEPELIGYFVEYSGMRFGMFYLAEFAEVVFAAAMVTTVFFGGWQVPGLTSAGFRLGDHLLALPHGAIVALQVAAFGAKTFFFCFLQLLIRWTVPRVRPDQLMQLGWKRLLPASLVNVLVTGLVVLWLGWR